MADKLGEAIVEIKGDLSKLKQDLGKAQSEVNSSVKNMGKSLEKLGGKTKKVGGFFTKFVTGPIAGLTGAMGALTLSTVKAGDEIAKTAQKAGVSAEFFQEARFALGQFDVSQQDVEKTLGRLNTRLGQAVNGNKRYSEALNELGIDLKAVENGSLTTEDAFMQSVRALQNVENTTERARLATDLFGKKLGRELGPVLNANEGDLEAVMQKGRELGLVMDEETLKASERLSDGLDDVGQVFAGLRNQIAKDIIPVIADQLIPWFKDELVPILQTMADRIGNVVQWFMNLSPEMKKTIGIVTGLVTALGPLLAGIGTGITVIGKIVGSMGTAITTLKSLGTAFTVLTGPVGLVVGAIAGVIAIFATLFATNEDFRESVLSIWSEIKDFMVPLLDTLGKAVKDIWSEMQETIDVAMQLISEIVDLALKDIRQFWDEWGDEILQVTKVIFDVISTTIKTAINLIKDIIGFTLAVIRGDWTEAFERIKSVNETVLNFIRDLFKKVLEFLSILVSSIMEKIRESFDKRMNAIRTVTGKVLIAIKEAFISIFNRVREFLSNLWSKIFTRGKEALLNIKNMIVDIINRAKSGIQDRFNAVKSFLSNLWSRIFGRASEGVSNIRDKIVRIFDSGRVKIQKIWTAIKKAIGVRINNAKRTAVSIVNRIRDALGNAFESAKSKVTGALNTIKSVLKGVLNDGIRLINRMILRLNKVIRGANKAPKVNIPEVGLIPLLQDGGKILGQGLSIVGEAGPELLELPRGARVTPLGDEGGLEGPDFNLIQNIQAKAEASDMQRFTERALRRLAREFEL